MILIPVNDNVNTISSGVKTIAVLSDIGYFSSISGSNTRNCCKCFCFGNALTCTTVLTALVLGSLLLTILIRGDFTPHFSGHETSSPSVPLVVNFEISERNFILVANQSPGIFLVGPFKAPVHPAACVLHVDANPKFTLVVFQLRNGTDFTFQSRNLLR